MIILQAMSFLILVLIIVLVYYSILKMLKEYEEIGNENTDQDNLDLTNKQ
jgi:uncharacterized membrane protein